MSVRRGAKLNNLPLPEVLPGIKLSALSIIKVGMGSLGFMAVALTLSLLS